MRILSHEIYDHCFCNRDSTHFPMHSTIVIQGLLIHLFSFINEVGFSPQ